MFTQFSQADAMQMLRFSQSASHAWLQDLFSAKAVGKGGIVRRAVRDVEREVGRIALEAEVRRRGFHLIECGGQFIVICNAGQMRVIC